MTARDARDVLIAIPSIQGGHLLERMLPTLRCDPRNVVVLDQASSDSTAEVCEKSGVRLVQLGRPYTYTEACNHGAEIAKELDFEYLCVANNDITFRTNVLQELAAELDRDPTLGIVAPSQVIIDEHAGIEIMARRVYWNLHTVDFLHDLEQGSALPRRLEADFCELTCAIIRMTAIEEVGFLDDTYGFYHEDADFCFRLRTSGYGCAYLPRSQIDHYSSSTFKAKRQEQIDYQHRNRVHFAEKHLGLSVNCAPRVHAAWVHTPFASDLIPALDRFGLTESTGPRFAVGGIGAEPADYLLTTQQVSAVPDRWLPFHDRYTAVMATSRSMTAMLRDARFNSFHVPLGINPDVFSPYGPVGRLHDEVTFLAVLGFADLHALSVIRTAWARARPTGSRLVLVGQDVARRMGDAPDGRYTSGTVTVSCFSAERIVVHDHGRPLGDPEQAQLYRSVDFSIAPSPSGLSLEGLRSLACGTPWIASENGPVVPTDAPVRDTPMLAWTPEALAAGLARAHALSQSERARIVEDGLLYVGGHATLRHTAVAVRRALEATQGRDPARVVERIRRSKLPPSRAGSTPMSARPFRAKMTTAAARRVTRVGSLTSSFGLVWQQRGLRSALATATTIVRTRTLTLARRSLSSARGTLTLLPPPARGAPKNRAAESDPTCLLMGYIDAQLGIGQSLRGLALAMQTANLPFFIYPISVGVEGRRTIPYMAERYDQHTAHAVTIVEVSPAELPRVRAAVGEGHFAESYNVLRTYWELAKGPVEWKSLVEGIDEIWAPNQFCATAFQDFFAGPITVVPPCIEITSSARADRDRFGLRENTFYFMFSFDYHSFPERKNPLGVVRAFLNAFPDLAQPVGLVVKATGADDQYQAVRQQIQSLAAADDRIIIVDDNLPRDGMLSLIASIDSYVSLHRSEGFGLGMAEALMLRKPVIATNYSGNAEFVTEETGYPIGFELRPVRPEEYVHAAGQVWAYPNEDECSDAMRRIVAHEPEVARRSENGYEFVVQRFGAESVGRVVARRLSEIAASRHGPRATPG